MNQKRTLTADERLRHLVDDLKEMVPRCLHDGCSGAKRIRDALRKVGPPYYIEETD